MDHIDQISIGIAGAGLVGRLMAWRLARLGHRVSLFDADQRSGDASAGMTAAAMISPFAELAVSEPEIFTLGMSSLSLYPQWLGELSTEAQCTVMYRHQGSLAVAHAQDIGVLRHFQGLLSHRLPRGYVDAIECCDAHKIAEYEPSLAGRFTQGVFLAQEAQLDNAQLFHALAVALDRLSVDWHVEEAVQALSERSISTAKGGYAFDLVIDARGTGAKDQVAVRGVRGEVLTVDAPDVVLTRPIRLMHPRYMLYVVPREQQRFIIGATELESENRGEVTVRSALELLSALYSLHPSFAEARIVKWSVNCRPALPNNLPLVTWVNGVLTINGLYRHGYLLAPACVVAAMTLVEQRDK